MDRWLGVFDTGRVLNPATAASQFRGGIVMGLGQALTEEVSFDTRTGRIMNPSLAHSWLLGLTAALGAGLVRRELRTAEPFLDLRVFGGNLPLLVTYLRNFLAAVISYALLYGFTQWLQDGRGLTPAVAGLILLPMFLTAIVVSTLTGRRPQIRGKLLAGASVQVAACGLLLLLHAHSPIWMLAGITLIAGIPQGLNSLANQNAVFHQADPERMGASAGLLRTFWYLGAIGASAANAAVYPDGADTAGLHELAVFIGVCAVLLLIAVLLDRSLMKIGINDAD